MYNHPIEPIQAENKKLHFFREGVAGGTDISQNLFSIKDHLHGHQIRGDRLILKMDVEGAELDALEAVPDDTLDRFEQIVFEVHWLNNLDDLAFAIGFVEYSADSTALSRCFMFMPTILMDQTGSPSSLASPFLRC